MISLTRIPRETAKFEKGRRFSIMKFNAQKTQPVSMTPRGVLERKYANCRANLLLIVITSAINLFTVTFASSYFLFAPSLPTLFLEVLLIEAGEAGVELAALVIPFVFGPVLTAPYLLCWIFSKKRVGWMVAALVFFSIDCIYLVTMYQLSAVILDLLFHAFVMFYLITGVVHGFKLKNLPAEEPVEATAEPASENAFDTFDQKDFSYDTASASEDAGDDHVAKSDKE
jgi:hypothetical protein